MKILMLLLILLLAACAATPIRNQANLAKNFNWDPNFLSVMQGPTTQTRTVINFVMPKSAEHDLVVTEKESGKIIQDAVYGQKASSRSYSPWKVVEVELQNLKLGTEYQLQIELSNGKKKLQETREFTTLNTEQKDLKFMLGSCMSDSYSQVGDQIWPAILKHDPQFYLLIGDQVYADIYSSRYLGVAADPRHIWERYIDSRLSVALFRQKKLKPVYAIWDDHDYGENNGDKSFPYKMQVKDIFRTFYPLATDSQLEVGPGVAFALELGNQKFYFLDDRSFRDSNEKKDGDHFGLQQRQWLYQSLKNFSGQNGIWLISGDQFFGAYHPFESFEGNHSLQFREFLNQLKSIGKKVVFASGDRHLVELMQIGPKELDYQTYEITSSGLHSTLYPGSLASAPNPRRVGGVDGVNNFAIINSTVSSEGLKIKLNSFNEKNQLLISTDLLIQ